MGAWERLVVKRLPLGAVIALTLISLRASAAQPPLALRDLLSIGVAAGPASLKWGATRRQIQRQYPQMSEHPAFIGFRLQGRVSEQGCTYNVYLSGSRKSDRLVQVWIAHSAGPPADCRKDLESTLEALYGPPSTTTAPATQDSGPVTLSAWQSATTCVSLRWEEQGVEHGVSPLTVSLGDLQGGCS